MRAPSSPSLAAFVPRRALLPTLALLATLVFTGCDSSDPDDLLDTVTVSGTIGNAATLGGRPVGGATLTFTAAASAAPNGTALASAATTVRTADDGSYTADLAPGPYTVTIERAGYAPTTRSITATEGVTLSETLTGSVTVTGSLANSLDGEATGLGGARVVFLFEDALSGDPIGQDADLETLADDNGQFTFPDAPFGTFTCVVYATGFVPAVLTSVDVPETDAGIDLSPAVVTEQPPEGAYRIVLTWGANPRDLDSHLTGPNGPGERFHIFYASGTYGDSNLDLDDTNSFGPETITLFPTEDGVYRYSVHNYTNRFDTSGALGIAGQQEDGRPAVVEVFSGDRLLRRYVAPAAAADAGDTWRVFEMTINGNDVSFAGAQPDGLSYVLATSVSDLGTFLHNGWPAKGVSN